jgi:predicted membrane metal-binding protein
LSSTVSASVGAVLMTSPISAIIWGYITPIGIFSTIIISPLVTFFLVFGLISVILCLIFPFLSYPLGTILQIVYYIIEYVAFLFAKVPPIIL